jgi:hypothetical protein
LSFRFNIFKDDVIPTDVTKCSSISIPQAYKIKLAETTLAERQARCRYAWHDFHVTALKELRAAALLQSKQHPTT